MAGASKIRAGQAYVELLAEDNKLVRGLERAQRMLTQFGAKVRNIGAVTAAAGAAMTAPFLAASKIFQDVGDDLAKMSARTGISVEALSELGFAADQSGSNLQELEQGVRRMQATVIDAGRGLSTATDALETLGLTVSDLQALNPEQQFLTIADRLAAVEDPTLRAATAMQILGRSGTSLLPLLADGAAGIEELRKQARDLGVTVSTEAAERAVRLGDAIDVLRAGAKAAAFAVGDALAPSLIGAAEAAGRVVGNAIQLVKTNRELIATVFKVGVGISLAGIAFTALGVGIIGLGAVFGAAATILTTIGTIIGTLLSPLGLATAAVVALGAAIFRQSKAGGAALQWLRDQFTAISKAAGEAFGAIGKALNAGDLKIATEVAGAALELAWAKSMKAISSVWTDGLADMLTRYHNFIASVQEASLLGLDKVKTAHRDLTTDVAKGIANISRDANIASVRTREAAQKAAVEARFVGVPLTKEAERELAQIEHDANQAVLRLRNENVQAHAAEDLVRDEDQTAAADKLESALIAVEDELAARQKLTDQAREDRIVAAAKKLEDAEAKFDAAVAAADALPPVLTTKLAELAGGLEAFSNAGTRIKAVGTFSPSALSGLHASDDRNLEKVVDNAERLVKVCTDILRKATFGAGNFL